MVFIQGKSNRKPSGGRYKRVLHQKRLYRMGRFPRLTKLGEFKRREIRIRNGSLNFVLLNIDKVNVLDPKTKKYSIETIKTILECPANRNYVRRNIMTKGTIIDTTKGKARITNRPGQEGAVNAVLVV